MSCIIFKDHHHSAKRCGIRWEGSHSQGLNASQSFQSYCVTKIQEMAPAFESRMQHNYMQLTKDSLGSSPTLDIIWQGCRAGGRRKKRPYFSQVRERDVKGWGWLKYTMYNEKWKASTSVFWTLYLKQSFFNYFAQYYWSTWCSLPLCVLLES